MIGIGIITFLANTHSATLAALKKYPLGTAEVALVNSYQEGVEVSREMVMRGARALISRGGYTFFMRESGLPVPVLDIPFTVHNFASILAEAHEKYGKVAVVGGATVLETVKIFAPYGEGEVIYYEVNTVEDYEMAAHRGKACGVAALVGGYDETRFAENVGLKRVIVSSNVDELDAAIGEAMKIVGQIEQEQRRSEQLRALFDIIGEGLVMVDSNGAVTHLNRKAKKILGPESGTMIGAPVINCPLKNGIESVLATGQGINYELHEWNGYKYACTIEAMRIDGRTTGVVAKLQEVEYVRNMEEKIRKQLYERGLVTQHTFSDILGGTSTLQEAVRKAKKYSLVDSTVLIIGESGTGKELFAQSIHNYSLRREGPFVAVNCATIPSNLLESELFGYAEGAFTGAKKGGKIGLFEMAHLGSLFLDEIGEMDVQMQARLLRVLEEKRVMRVGDNRVIPIDVRIIAATNKDLYQMVRAGCFREDLFYRLNVLYLKLPPLRESRDEVITLVDHFIQIFSDKHKRQVMRITPDGMAVLLRHGWPGNARELANVIERLVITSLKTDVDGETVMEAIGVPSYFDEDEDCRVNHAAAPEIIKKVLEECRGNKTIAAKKLNISRPTLYRRLNDLKAN